MKNMSFVPQKFANPSADTDAPDTVADKLFGVPRTILMLVIGLVPIFFLPMVYAPLGY